MTRHDLATLRQKELVGTISMVSWGILVLMKVFSPHADTMFLARAAVITGWISLAAWVRLDAIYRQAATFRWTLLATIAGPIGFLIYYVARIPSPPVCLRCGAELLSPSQPCGSCGGQTALGKAISVMHKAYSSLVDPNALSTPERARETTARLVLICLVAMVVILILGYDQVIYPISTIFGVLFALSMAGYWVLLAWWVYVDATWRKMAALPWAVLTLTTNILGLVTYLVIRNPDPRKCHVCSAYLPIGLKRCPYCGSEANRTCPHCQASVEPDWIYCPACAGKLPPTPEVIATASENVRLALSGTVVEAQTGSPIAGAEVRVDSKVEARSALTDAAGRFFLNDLAPRPYVLIASKEGYGAEVRSCTPEAASASTVHFSLRPA